ncbi:hypothetical protein [Salinarimonas sp.]|uniref:hypothetical protein n=1 Tax=Salinarimonas sp. TaxID=2766526 RepID=UPI0032D99CA4
MDADTKDRIAKSLVGAGAPIVCFLAGRSALRYATQMARDPLPRAGYAFGPDFGDHFARAIEENPAIHDGAVIVVRESGARYAILGWSFRLFPPPADVFEAVNVGSAHNSCLHMSAVSGVDFVVKPTDVSAVLFEHGRARTVEPDLEPAFGLGRR